MIIRLLIMNKYLDHFFFASCLAFTINSFFNYFIKPKSFKGDLIVSIYFPGGKSSGS
jgi:hypothetical protein